MAESPASGPLHRLQSELNGAKSQWEYLQDRIANGYKDAFKAHVGALKEMEQAALLEEQQTARVRGIFLFVGSVVAVGFAGGVVGGLMSPWVKKAGEGTAKFVIREGMKDAAKRFAQQTVAELVPQAPAKPKVAESPYLPASPDPIDVYLDHKEELDGCFAIVNSWLQQTINASNAGGWSVDQGAAILDNFRRDCPLLSEVPDPNQIPERSKIANSAELLMWVAWAGIRDWTYWNKLYDALEHNTEHNMWELDGVNAEWKLDPVRDRLRVLGIQGVERSEPIGTMYPNTHMVLDLRKLRALRVQGLPSFPFARMKDLHLYGMDDLQLRGQFLDGLQDLRPFHVN